MYRVNRSVRFLLAIMLAAGIVTLTGHSTAHANTGVEPCLMCASHADLSGTVPVQAHRVPVEISIQTAAGMVSVRPLPRGFIHTFQSRAPPKI